MGNKERRIKVPTTGVFDFPSLILGGKGKYVDKTELLYQLANDADQQLFISRPRRFGKSLMLSTLKAMFEGRRELFKGLAIDKLPWEGWTQPTPVYSFTMGDVSGENYAEVKEELGVLVDGLFEQAGLSVPEKGTIPGKFRNFLVAAAAKSPTKKIVVLIDEYDEPVAAFLDDLKTLRRVRKLLHDFYEKLKFSSDSIRFLMMTGVTKLTKFSVFSGLNHLTDISSFQQYATLLGYTPDELDGALRENVEELGVQNGMDFAAAKKAILSWYDGYRFSPDSVARVCNPVSLGSALKIGKLKGYWETTGRTTLVINRMANAGKLPADLENVPMLGYADAVIETPKEVCVFEFKYRKSAKAAIRQIRERGYADKWIGGERPVTLVGINFNPKKRNIDMPIIEKV